MSAHGLLYQSLMVDPQLFLFQQISITKAVMCYPVCGIMHIKGHLLLIEKCIPCNDSMVFLSSYLRGPLS